MRQVAAEREIDPMKDTTSDGRRQIPTISLVPFLLVTFGLVWAVLGSYILLPERMARTFGQMTGQHPLFYLAVYAPAIAAFPLVARYGGLKGLRRFLSRMRLWRSSPAWWAFLVVGLPLVFFIGAALKGDLVAAMPRFSSWQSLAALLGLVAIKGPVEEFGWRGLALPLLQRRLAPIWAALILGIVWGFWHLPAFLLSGTQQSAWSFAPFFVGTVAISVLMTALFNASAGSILLAALFHFQLINPLWPDAQPYDTYLLVAVAVVVVLLNRSSMFSTEGAVTEVVPKEGAATE